MKNRVDFNGRKTSLVYLERDGQYLILHRTKKEHDENGDKWIGGFGGSRSSKAIARKEALLKNERGNDVNDKN